jgi:hypothetical protein
MGRHSKILIGFVTERKIIKNSDTPTNLWEYRSLSISLACIDGFRIHFMGLAYSRPQKMLE